MKGDSGAMKGEYAFRKGMGVKKAPRLKGKCRVLSPRTVEVVLLGKKKKDEKKGGGGGKPI